MENRKPSLKNPCGSSSKKKNPLCPIFIPSLLHSNHFTSIPQNFFSELSSLSSISVDDNPFTSWEIPMSLCQATAFRSLARLGLTFISFSLLFAFAASLQRRSRHAVHCRDLAPDLFLLVHVQDQKGAPCQDLGICGDLGIAC